MRNKKGQFIKGAYVGFGFKKGSIPWNKGGEHSEETKKKMRENPHGFKKGHTPWHKGKKVPSLGRKGRTPWNKNTKGVMKPNQTSFKKGVHVSSKTEFKKGVIIPSMFKKGQSLKGEKSGNWKGGISFMSDYKSIIDNRRRARKIGNGGSHTLGEWENLKAQYNWTCPSCAKSVPEIKLTQDHIIPISLGGSDNIENIQPLCKSCNCRKNAKIIKYENK
jgi:hypothetical protein